MLSRLTARRRVIAFDNAGIGLSEGTVQSSITEMADTVLGFVDALGLLLGGRGRPRCLVCVRAKRVTGRRENVRTT